MSKNVKELTPKQLSAVHYLVRGRSISQTAKQVGVVRQTVANWMKKPEFTNEMSRQQDLLMQEIHDKAIAFSELALERVVEIMKDQNASKSEQLRAARILLSEGDKAMEAIAFVERLEDVEELVQLIKNADFK